MRWFSLSHDQKFGDCARDQRVTDPVKLNRCLESPTLIEDRLEQAVVLHRTYAPGSAPGAFLGAVILNCRGRPIPVQSQIKRNGCFLILALGA